MGQSIGEYGSEYANHFETNSKSRPQHLRVYFKLQLAAPWTACDLLGACFVIQVTGCDGLTYYCVN